MPARRTETPTEKEWLAQKPRLKKLWLEERKSTAAVAKIMEEDHSFNATYAKWRQRHTSFYASLTDRSIGYRNT